MTAEPKAETTMISRLKARIEEAVSRPLTITFDEEPSDDDIPEQWMDEGDTPVMEETT